MRFNSVSRCGAHAICMWVCSAFKQVTFYNHFKDIDGQKEITTIHLDKQGAPVNIHFYENQLVGDYDIIRDSRNWIASLLKSRPRRDLTPWVEAYVALRESPNSKIDLVQWARSEEYRNGIAKMLDITPDPTALGRVSRFGRGSSFDNLECDYRAWDMRIESRWKQVMRLPDKDRYLDAFRKFPILKKYV